MQFKLVPEAPDSLAFLETVQGAIPLVPGTEDDCCARIMRETAIGPRDEARTWLTFLRALGLAAEGQAGFYRERTEPDPESVRRMFLERVYGAREVLDLLEVAEEPRSATEVFERFRDSGSIPHYERHKHRQRLSEIWGERVRRLLEWAVLLELAERVDGGYVRAG